MHILRTPDDAADGLVDYPRSHRYASIPSGDGQDLRIHLVSAYRAPYPDHDLTVGSRAFTQLLPTRPDNPMYPENYEAWKVLDTFSKPVLTIFSDKDSVAPDGWKPIVGRIPGATGQPHVILEGGGHFVQEDLPEQYPETLVRWLGDLGDRPIATVVRR